MSETITETLTRLKTLIQEKAPNIDVSPGSVFNEIILGLEGQIQNQVYSDISAVSTQQTVKDVLASFADTYSPTIDRLASNYGVARNQGTTSTGIIKVFVSTAKNYFIAAGATFTLQTLGYTYASISDVTIDYSNHPEQLRTETEGYSFLLPVASTTTGQHNTISNGARFDPISTTYIPQYIKSEAYGTFSPGLDTETDRELIERFRSGLSANNLLTAASIDSKLTSLYPGFCGVYLADTTSPINTRSLSTPLNLKIPGCVDVYTKNSITIPQVSFEVVGTWSVDDQIWYLDIAKTDAPGFYRIVNVQVKDAVDLEYLQFSTTYDYDTTQTTLTSSTQITGIHRAQYQTVSFVGAAASLNSDGKTTIQQSAYVLMN